MTCSWPTWRRELLTAGIMLWSLAIAGLSAPALAEPSVLVLSSRDSAAYRQVAESFQAYLQDEVAGVAFVPVSLEDGEAASQPRLAALEGKEIALVYALGARATRLAAERYPTVPVVSGMVFSAADLESLPNVTGVALEFPQATQLQWMRRLLPKARRIAVLFDPARNQAWVDSARRAAQQEGLELIPIAVHDAKDLPAGLKKLDRSADALWAIPDKTVYSGKTLKQVLLSSFRSRIPVVGLSGAWVKAGALYALDRDYPDLGRQNGAIAKRLLAGTSPAAVKLETPKAAVYSLNLKTARHMKLTIEEDLVAGAVHAYE
jgi:putative ABC transport system substrate-binding protein